MTIIRELDLEPIKYSTQEMVAVFIIERMHPFQSNVTEKVTQCVGVFDTAEKATDFIKTNHIKGNVYFIAEGFCMG